MCASYCVHESAGAMEPGVGSPEAGLQNIVNLLVWILGVRPRNCTRTILTLSSLSALTCILFLARRRLSDPWRSDELRLHLTQPLVLSTSHRNLHLKASFHKDKERQQTLSEIIWSSKSGAR